MMKRNNEVSLLLINLLGAGLCLALIAAFVWLTFFRGDQTAAVISELSEGIQVARRDLTEVRASLDETTAQLQRRRVELAAGGQLPDQTPIEEYFQMLSRIASQHRLRVVRHNPLSPRAYPGLLEQRYAYEINGSMPDIVRFLRAIEDARYWADVSHLRVSGGPQPNQGDARNRVASLTISVFSSSGAAASERG